jgi:hypothetical protein
VAQVKECSSSKLEALSLIPNTEKTKQNKKKGRKLMTNTRTPDPIAEDKFETSSNRFLQKFMLHTHTKSLS